MNPEQPSTGGIWGESGVPEQHPRWQEAYSEMTGVWPPDQLDYPPTGPLPVHRKFAAVGSMALVAVVAIAVTTATLWMLRRPEPQPTPQPPTVTATVTPPTVTAAPTTITETTVQTPVHDETLDEQYIRLFKDFTGWGVTDPQPLIAIAHQQCDYLAIPGNTPSSAAAVLMERFTAPVEPGHPKRPMSRQEAFAMVQAAVTVYCPEYKREL
jgi:hypothetical protein